MSIAGILNDCQRELQQHAPSLEVLIDVYNNNPVRTLEMLIPEIDKLLAFGKGKALSSGNQNPSPPEALLISFVSRFFAELLSRVNDNLSHFGIEYLVLRSNAENSTIRLKALQILSNVLDLCQYIPEEMFSTVGNSFLQRSRDKSSSIRSLAILNLRLFVAEVETCEFTQEILFHLDDTSKDVRMSALSVVSMRAETVHKVVQRCLDKDIQVRLLAMHRILCSVEMSSLSQDQKYTVILRISKDPSVKVRKKALDVVYSWWRYFDEDALAFLKALGIPKSDADTSEVINTLIYLSLENGGFSSLIMPLLLASEDQISAEQLIGLYCSLQFLQENKVVDAEYLPDPHTCFEVILNHEDASNMRLKYVLKLTIDFLDIRDPECTAQFIKLLKSLLLDMSLSDSREEIVASYGSELLLKLGAFDVIMDLLETLKCDSNQSSVDPDGDPIPEFLEKSKVQALYRGLLILEKLLSIQELDQIPVSKELLQIISPRDIIRGLTHSHGNEELLKVAVKCLALYSVFENDVARTGAQLDVFNQLLCLDQLSSSVRETTLMGIFDMAVSLRIFQNMTDGTIEYQLFQNILTLLSYKTVTRSFAVTNSLLTGLGKLMVLELLDCDDVKSIVSKMMRLVATSVVIDSSSTRISLLGVMETFIQINDQARVFIFDRFSTVLVESMFGEDRVYGCNDHFVQYIRYFVWLLTENYTFDLLFQLLAIELGTLILAFLHLGEKSGVIPDTQYCVIQAFASLISTMPVYNFELTLLSEIVSCKLLKFRWELECKQEIYIIRAASQSTFHVSDNSVEHTKGTRDRILGKVQELIELAECLSRSNGYSAHSQKRKHSQIY